MTLDESIELWQKEHEHEIVYACNMDSEVHEIVDRINPWHTGKPTEDGEYVVLCQYRKDDGKLRKYKTVFEFKNGEWTKLPALEGNLDEYKLIAWYGQKITPYEGEITNS